MSIKLTGEALKLAKELKVEMDRRAALQDQLAQRHNALREEWRKNALELNAYWEKECARLFELIGLPQDQLSEYALHVQFVLEHGDAYLYKPDEKEETTDARPQRLN